MLVHLPREEGYGRSPPDKNGPPLSGYGAETMSRALARAIADLLEHLLRLLTWDRGKDCQRSRCSLSIPVCRCSSPTPAAHGSAVQMRTPD